MKSKRMKGAGRVTRVGNQKNTRRIGGENIKETAWTGQPWFTREIILKSSHSVAYYQLFLIVTGYCCRCRLLSLIRPLNRLDEKAKTWINLAQHRDKLWVTENAVMNLRVPSKAGNFLTG
jgi:hypothetical protein